MTRRLVKGFKPSTVQQQHRDSVDLNYMLKTAVSSSLPLPSGSIPPMWGDFSGASFQAAQDKVVAIKQRFSELPSRVRTYFQNSPLVMLRFLDDPGNHPEARRLGILPPEPKEAPAPKTLAQEVSEGVALALKADKESQPRGRGE